MNDAMVSGFTPASGGAPAGQNTIKNHIVNQLVSISPYISLSRSYEVAEVYAKYYGRSAPTTAVPAYVYELDIPNASSATLIDPVQELAKFLGTPFASFFYQHNGAQDVLLGLVDSAMFGHVLARQIRSPGAPTGRGPNITDELQALVRALRDAEVLAQGAISRACLVHKHPVV